MQLPLNLPYPPPRVILRALPEGSLLSDTVCSKMSCWLRSLHDAQVEQYIFHNHRKKQQGNVLLLFLHVKKA
jgi:hypothetical protein